MVFVASDSFGLKARLDKAGLGYRERTVPTLNLHPLFPGSEAPCA